MKFIYFIFAFYIQNFKYNKNWRFSIYDETMSDEILLVGNRKD